MDRFIRLSIMMFLELFIWGSWFVTIAPFMQSHGMFDTVPWAYSVGPIAAIVSPFFLGMIADRFFATERVLAALMFLGGAAMFCLPVAARLNNPWIFIGILFLHTLCYFPTLGLTNNLAFHNLTNRERQFPLIRVFGTFGWIASNLVIGWLAFGQSSMQFVVVGVACMALGLFSFFLPHTPPPAKGKQISFRDVLGLDALSLMKDRSFLIFILSSLAICIPLAAYFQYGQVFAGVAGLKPPENYMWMGQATEVFFMIAMPLFFALLGVRWMLMVGMAAWVVRYGLFASSWGENAKWMVITGILLHGICYDFFFVTGFIYTDRRASEKIRAQAQGFLVLVTQGIGMLIGAQAAGFIKNTYTEPDVKAVMVQSTELSRESYALQDIGKTLEQQAGKLKQEASKPLGELDPTKTTARVDELEATVARMLGKEQPRESAQVLRNEFEAGAKQIRADVKIALAPSTKDTGELMLTPKIHRELQRLTETASDLAMDLAQHKGEQAGSKAEEASNSVAWMKVWIVPCAMSGVVMILFMLLFKDDGKRAKPEEAELVEAGKV